MGRRADIKVGTLCNNNCRFCAQAMYRIFNKPLDRIKSDLDKARSDGCDEVVLTGGEPTVRRDIFDIVKYARKIGFDYIQIQSNGRMFYYKRFCEKLIDAGANEFAPAVHGHIPEVHDYLTRAPGSFKQTITGIKNLKELGQQVVVNSVIVKTNYRFAPQMAKLFVDLHVDQFQFAFVHAVGNAMVYKESTLPLVSLALPYLKRGLQIALDAGITCMVEATPFCVMQGYEQQVSDFYVPPTEVREYDRVFAHYEETRKEIKRKFPQCKDCKYRLICEGPWKEYPETFGSSEFQPVYGKLIKSPDEIFKRRN